ncbi:MAG: phosphatase PAP2 family protein [Bacteroidota bacterium]|nr:phosphatase PAP2 family protein [Bacteroidota bacterium]
MPRFGIPILAGLLGLNPATLALAQQAPSPYQTRFALEAPLTLGLAGLSATGLYLVQHKRVAPATELAALAPARVPALDRFSAGAYSERAQATSDALTYGTLALVPALLAFDAPVHGRYGQVAGLYLETMATTAAIFTLTVGTVYRYRPYLYGPSGGSRRSGAVAADSFFGGHVAHTATATFFAAQVFHDFNPGSRAHPYVWGAAAAVPAVVAYFRIKAGKHFLTDNLVGYAVGATVGVLVPRLHRTAAGFDGAALPPQRFTDSLIGSAVGATAGVVVLHFYKKLRGNNVSLTPIQGLNVNGYAYGGMRLVRTL